MADRYVWHDGEWVKVVRRPPRPRIHIISDYHEPFKSMADGQMYESKSAYRADLKARGFVELGSDAPDAKPRYDEGDIARDIADVIDGRVPIEGGNHAPSGFDTSDL